MSEIAMNMDKLTRFNQKLLAILGTGILVAVVVSILGVVVGFLFDIFGRRTHKNEGVAVQQLQLPSSDSAAEAKVTYLPALQFDSAVAKYLIPVHQLVANEASGFGGFSKRTSGSSYSRGSNTGICNNFVLYDYEKNTSKLLFSNKVKISKWRYFAIDTLKLLVFKVVNNDSNHDGYLNSDDFECIYIYYLNDGQLECYMFDNQTVVDFNLLKKTVLLSIELGIDENSDRKYDSTLEPQRIAAINIRTRKIQEIIDDSIYKQVHDIMNTAH
ncbi:hypothetical protein GC194_08725 [bacterium]|nr:hypothetical protein [bacterium]